MKYSEILGTCTECVTRKYDHAIVVFDGYLNSSTKDMTHQRRLKSKIGATVIFTEKKDLTITKSEFLMLGETLEKNNCKSYYASADAHLLIVQKEVESATIMKTVLVSDDTDLLVLLCYHASLDTCNLLFKPEPPQNTKNIRVWDIQAVKRGQKYAIIF